VDACWHAGRGARLSARARLAAPRDRSCGAARGWPHTVPVCAPPGALPAAPAQDGCRSGRRKRRTLIRTSMPLAPGEEAPGPGRPEGRRPERRWTPLAAAYPPRSTLLSVSKSSGTPLANWGRGHVQTHPSAHRGARYDGGGCVRELGRLSRP
jgi:hypothetical protein